LFSCPVKCQHDAICFFYILSLNDCGKLV
jgi:hypothetical protein